MKPLLVGELNPHGSDPRHALFPYPKNGSGGRLCYKILGMSRLQYMSTFDRVNLCTGKWDRKKAAEKALEIIGETGPRIIVMLGAKVTRAFMYKYYVPFIYHQKYGKTMVTLPHPSGLNRIWNDEKNFRGARAMMQMAGVKVLHE